MMNTIKVGVFPGAINEYAVEDTATVKEALEMAGLSVGAEQDVKLDGESVGLDTVVGTGKMLLLTKRIKGAVDTIKIGVFPGAINEYTVEDGTTVKEALAMAGLTVGAEQDIKLDGESVELNTVISGGKMLLLTKRIKGAR